MNFKTEILVSFRKILVPFRTTKDCHSCRSLLLVWQICSLNWDLYMDSFVGTLRFSFDGPVAIYLLLMQGSHVQIQGMKSYIFYFWHPWGPKFKSGFHNSVWDYVVPGRISWITLEIYKLKIWERVLAHSFSGIHKCKIICSVVIQSVMLVFFSTQICELLLGGYGVIKGGASDR